MNNLQQFGPKPKAKITISWNFTAGFILLTTALISMRGRYGYVLEYDVERKHLESRLTLQC